MITKFGKRFLTSYLAGISTFSKKDIAVGIANGTDYALSDTNSRLGFEFYRIQASFGSIDIQTNNNVSTYAVVYKATLPQDVAGTITEIGLYPQTQSSNSNYDSNMISDFENNLLWLDSSGVPASIISSPSVAPFPRIGNALIPVIATSNSTKEYISNIGNFNISGYSGNDTIVLAYNQADTNLSSITIKFYSSDTEYFYTTIAAPATSGNKIIPTTFSSLLSSAGNPDMNSIYKVGILATAKNTGATTINLEGLRINDEDTFDAAYGLISRSLLATPLEKKAGRPADIEFRLEISFGG
jgi:hypothetical protein